MKKEHLTYICEEFALTESNVTYGALLNPDPIDICDLVVAPGMHDLLFDIWWRHGVRVFCKLECEQTAKRIIQHIKDTKILFL